ncbi:unnamed protein product [Symbiodinium sp. CCMP2592]|nr:unnamed protein product [Symbiodinium sp. CCMP2592]
MDTDGLTWNVLGEEVQSSLGNVKENVGPTDAYLYFVLAVLLLLALILGPRFVLQSLSRRAGQATRVVECGSCHHRQYVQANISAFVCEGCRRTNHVSYWVKPEELLYCASGPIKFFQFQRAGRAFWREVSERESEPAHGARDCPTNEPAPKQTDPDIESLSNLGEESVVPRCVVCLDEPGCMVLLPCSHGAVCEACVTKIVQNQACGGAHCPHCRSNIGTVVKLRDFKGDMASGMELRIPMARHRWSDPGFVIAEGRVLPRVPDAEAARAQCLQRREPQLGLIEDEARQLNDQIKQAKKVVKDSVEQPKIDWANPPPELVEDAKKHGLDLTDPLVLQELQRMEREGFDKTVNEEPSGPSQARSSVEEEEEEDSEPPVPWKRYFAFFAVVYVFWCLVDLAILNLAPKRPRPLRPPPPAPRPARPVSVEGHARAEEPVLDVEAVIIEEPEPEVNPPEFPELDEVPPPPSQGYFASMYEAIAPWIVGEADETEL